MPFVGILLFLAVSYVVSSPRLTRAARWMAAIESDVDHVEALATNRCLAVVSGDGAWR